MYDKDRDLAALADFQLRSLEFCQRVAEIAKKLNTDADEAQACLQDDVSRRNLHRVEGVSSSLTKISGYGCQEMETALRKTREEIDQWNRL